jgi:hypothetical protein
VGEPDYPAHRAYPEKQKEKEMFLYFLEIKGERFAYGVVATEYYQKRAAAQPGDNVGCSVNRAVN